MSSDESFSLQLSADSDSENQTFEKTPPNSEFRRTCIEAADPTTSRNSSEFLSENVGKVKNSEQNSSNQGVHKEIHFNIAPKCLENLFVLNTPVSSKGDTTVKSKKVNLKKRRECSSISSSKVSKGLSSPRFSRVKRRRIINISSSSDSEDDSRILNTGTIISHTERVTRSQTAEQRWKDLLKNGHLPKSIYWV